MKEITMSGMYFQHLEAGGERATRGGLKGGYHRVNAGLIQGNGGGIALPERNWAGGNYRPGAEFRALEFVAAFPWQIGTRFPASVGQLNTGHGTLALNKASNTSKGFNMLIGPNAHVARRNPAVPGHRGGFYEY